MTKREWQIEMANRFAKRDNVKKLTDEEIMDAYIEYIKTEPSGKGNVIDFARVILRKAQEK